VTTLPDDQPKAEEIVVAETRNDDQLIPESEQPHPKKEPSNLVMRCDFVA
jgi:hypothetical protein